MAASAPEKRILLVDDEPSVLSTLSEVVEGGGYQVETAPGGKEGIEALEREPYDVVVTDLNMPGLDGMEVLKYTRQHLPDTECIILTGFGSIRNSVEAIKMGAFDYITKPVKSDELLHAVAKAFKIRHLERENTLLRKELKKKYRFENIVGDSPAIQKIFELIEKVADTDSTVLITGESGTGKELIARAIHYNSYRKDNPLVVINCGAIPGELLESELFGHEKGAFTGAHKTRMGRFELANGGTIFLDEIGDMSPALQVKLLRVLQQQTFERVGSTRTIQGDVRIIAATNKDLKAAVEKGDFREDLYYRLNVIPVRVPPLRDRITDIPLLADFFLKKLSRDKSGATKKMTAEAMAALMAHDWPGNVRELENVIERIWVLCSEDEITLADLPESVGGEEAAPSSPGPISNIPQEGIEFDKAVDEYETALILKALKETSWVKSRAAKLLNINRTTLVEKMKRKNIQAPA